MNPMLLAMWLTVIGAAATIVLLIAWTATGRRHTALRVLGGVSGIITILAFFYWRFAA